MLIFFQKIFQPPQFYYDPPCLFGFLLKDSCIMMYLANLNINITAFILILSATFKTFKLLFEYYIIVLRRYHCCVCFHLILKSGKSFVKIESYLQIALFFFFYWNLKLPPPWPVHPPSLFQPPAYLILPNLPTPHPKLIRTPPFIQDP